MLDNQRKWNYSPDCPEGGKAWSQSMSLMCTLTLHKTERGYRLFRAPIREIYSLRADDTGRPEELRSGMKLRAPCEYKFSFDDSVPFEMLFGSQGFRYDPSSGRVECVMSDDLPSWMTFGESNRPKLRSYELNDDRNHIADVFVDRRSVEIFIDSEISMSFSFLQEKEVLSLKGTDHLCSRANPLASILRIA